MSKKSDPFYDENLGGICPITNKEVLDDCHIVIEFGYGSDKDLHTYTFSPVHDEVGKKVLNYIETLIESTYEEHPIQGVKLSKKPSVENFGQNVMHEYFSKEWGDSDDEDKHNQIKGEWGLDID